MLDWAGLAAEPPGVPARSVVASPSGVRHITHLWPLDLALQLARAQGCIHAFQADDWLVPTAGLAPDRGMPGEGVIDIPRLRAMAEAAGHNPPVAAPAGVHSSPTPLPGRKGRPR